MSNSMVGAYPRYATYANGQKIILIGDSITSANGGISTATPIQAIANTYDSKGFFNQANVMLGHAFDMIGNAGIGGQTTTQIAARFETDVVAYRPDWVCILAGTNDSSSASNTKANLASMYESAYRNGIRVIACTIPPSTAVQSKREWQLEVNSWITQYARTRPHIIVANIGAALVDNNTTWQPISGVLSDGTHPNTAGAILAGRMIYEALKNIVPAQNIDLAFSNGDLTNLLTNPMLYGTSTTAPTGWSVTGGTISYVPRTDGLAGNMVQFVNGSGVNTLITSNVTVDSVKLSVGDSFYSILEFECEGLDAAPAANTQALSLTMQSWNGSAFTSRGADLYWDTGYVNGRYPLSKGVLRTPVSTVPAGATLIQLYAQFRQAGTFRVGRAAVRKV
jgi:lysophospholipase L1-like esterase